MRYRICALVVVVLLVGLQVAVADGSFVPLAQGTAYQSSTTLLPASPNVFVSSINDGKVIVTPSSPLWTMQDGGPDWWGWGGSPLTENPHPVVLYTSGHSLTLDLTALPALGGTITTFGFEMEPNSYDFENFLVTFMNGEMVLGSIQQAVTGDYGATLFAASTNQLFTSVVITSNVDFAIADIRYADAPATAPEPSTIVLLAAGLLGVVGRRLRRRG